LKDEKEDQNKDEKEKNKPYTKSLVNCFVFEYVYFKWKKKEHR